MEEDKNFKAIIGVEKLNLWKKKKKKKTELL